MTTKVKVIIGVVVLGLGAVAYVVVKRRAISHQPQGYIQGHGTLTMRLPGR